MNAAAVLQHFVRVHGIRRALTLLAAGTLVITSLGGCAKLWPHWEDCNRCAEVELDNARVIDEQRPGH